jgi:hypothetical protein
MMKVADLTWIRLTHKPLFAWEKPDILYTSNVFDGIHRFSVLDRMTGCGFRDTETALRSLDGSAFWLRMGSFDVRNYPELSIDDAIVLLKSDASDFCGPPRVRLRDVEL